MFVILLLLIVLSYYLLLFIIPIANIYAIFKIYIELAHKFNKSTGFGVGLIFLSVIFFPMLAFGDATYEDSIIETNITDLNPNLRNIADLIQEEAEEIAELASYKSKIGEALEDIKEQMSWNPVQ